MKYRVKVIVTEVYTTWVEADDVYDAEEKAVKQLDSGELFADSENVSTSIIDTDDEEDD